MKRVGCFQPKLWDGKDARESRSTTGEEALLYGDENDAIVEQKELCVGGVALKEELYTKKGIQRASRWTVLWEALNLTRD